MDASLLNLKDISASKNANTRMSESTAAALKCRVKMCRRNCLSQTLIKESQFFFSLKECEWHINLGIVLVLGFKFFP